MIAFVGPDGSGKSTAIENIDRWLGGFLNITLGHMGKPPKSLTSRVVDRLVSLVERMTGSTSPPARTPPDREVAGGSTLHSLYAWQLCRLARDRKRESDRFARATRHGEIILCDRYPMPGLTSMEGTHGHRLHKARGRLARRWIRLERNVHDSIARPDLSIGLRVAPEMAASRQPDDGPEFVSFRADEFFVFSEANAQMLSVVDASEPIDDVSRRVRRLVWNAL